MHLHKHLYIATLSLLAFASCTQTNTTAPAKPVTQDTSAVKKNNAALSVYQLQGNWLTQDNKTITLADLKGKVQVIAMIFTGCRYACPKIVGDMEDIELQIPAALKGKVGFTLVSFDTERDTVAHLKKFATDMNLGSNWTLLHGSEQQVRELSMVLDVNYEKQANGDFNHTSIISVFDKNGAIALRHEGLEIDAKEFVKQILPLVN